MVCSMYLPLYLYTWRYKNNGDGLSDSQYMFGRPQSRYTSSHYTKYILYHSQYAVSCTLAELSWILTNSCHMFIDRRNLGGLSGPGKPSDPFTLILRSPGWDRSICWIHFEYHPRYKGVLMMGRLPAIAAVSPHHDHVQLETYTEGVIEPHLWP
jgi:hypothetical protein